MALSRSFLITLSALPLVAVTCPASAQSSGEYTEFLKFCASKNGIPNGDPSNPSCMPGGSSSSSGYSSSEQAMLGIAGAIGSALGNAIRESLEADARRAAMQQMQQQWELERARIFAAKERERLSREMRERNEALIANLKGGVRVPDLSMSRVGNTQLKMKTTEEMFGSGRAVATSGVDPKAAWDAYLAALQKKNDAALRLAAATSHKANTQILLDMAMRKTETARLSDSGDPLSEAEKVAAQASQLNDAATTDLEKAKAQSDEAQKELELASSAATGVKVESRSDGVSASAEAAASSAGAGFDSANDPMVVDLRDNPSGAAAITDNSGPMVVDARNVPSVLTGLPRLEEVENSPGRGAWLTGMEAITKRDWNVAVASFESALQKDPGNAALARAVELARWRRDWRDPGAQPIVSSDASQKKDIVVPEDADLEFLYSHLLEGPPPATAVVAPENSDLELLFARDKTLWDYQEEEAAREPLRGESLAIFDRRLRALSLNIRAAGADRRYSMEENEQLLLARIDLARTLETDSYQLLSKGDWRGAVALLDRAALQVPADAAHYKKRSESIRQSFGSTAPSLSEMLTAPPRPSNSASAKSAYDLAYEAEMAAYRQEMEKQKALSAEYERAQAEFVAERARLAELARKKRVEWEQAVAACKAGDYSACEKSPQ